MGDEGTISLEKNSTFLFHTFLTPQIHFIAIIITVVLAVVVVVVVNYHHHHHHHPNLVL